MRDLVHFTKQQNDMTLQNVKRLKMTVMPETPLYVKKLSEFAQIPKRGSAGAAGYDLCS